MASEAPTLQRSVLHSAVIDLMDNTARHEWQALAERTGVSFSWIVAFANDRVEHPSAARLEALHYALAGTRLPVNV